MSSFFHLMTGCRGSGRELEGHGDHWSRVRTAFPTPHYSNRRGKQCLCGESLSALGLFVAAVNQSSHQAHLYHSTEDCCCSCVSPSLWSVLLEAGTVCHIPTLPGPRAGSGTLQCAVNMSGSWFVTPGKTHTGPTLGFLPNNLFPINPSAISTIENFLYMWFLPCASLGPLLGHPTHLSKDFCPLDFVTRLFSSQPLPKELIQEKYF